ncbi:hypothetical protein NDU88_002522 [Pleurodeles waltl]|uniref:Reverse transcriptase domain-containing protein n=1 Tax=Pleurodeles waltl TaxID=8319 RepID=A0AAV7MPX9_PLEWA|nr:hypothetical protein NDU88_002522 [Pleurodeles waltl]
MSEAGCTKFLKERDLFTFNTDDREGLEEVLTVDKIAAASCSLHSGEVVGPNGLPIELYKCMSDKMAAHMLTMFQEACASGGLTTDQRTATIVVVPNKGKPPNYCGSCKLISPFNVEAKVLAKAWVPRLCQVKASVIHLDQTGFMPHRSMRLNLCCLYGVLHMMKLMYATQAALITLDAWMAFDSIKSHHIFANLA